MSIVSFHMYWYVIQSYYILHLLGSTNPSQTINHWSRRYIVCLYINVFIDLATETHGKDNVKIGCYQLSYVALPSLVQYIAFIKSQNSITT